MTLAISAIVFTLRLIQQLVAGGTCAIRDTAAARRERGLDPHPTDVMARPPGEAMGLQSLISVTLLGLVLARAGNVLA